jgi:hypothetical protein
MKTLTPEDIRRRERESPGEVAWKRSPKGEWRHWCHPLVYGFSTTEDEHPEHCPKCARTNLMHLFWILRTLTRGDGYVSDKEKAFFEEEEEVDQETKERLLSVSGYRLFG